MVLLILLIILFIVLRVNLNSKNKKDSVKNILYPFSGYLAPPSQWGVKQSDKNPGVGKHPQDKMYLVGQVGGESANIPQIQCPDIDGVKYKINIVGAFLEVNDQYGECGTKQDQTFQLTCGNPNQVSTFECDPSGTPCPVGMSCINRSCVPLKCTTSDNCIGAGSTIKGCPPKWNTSCDVDKQDCGDNLICINGKCEVNPMSNINTCMACVDADGKPYSGSEDGGTCAFMPNCENANTDGQNSICNVNTDKYKCRPREATAYLAKHCDGKTSCLGSTDSWDPNELGESNPFGPLPCRIKATDTASNDFEKPYLQLPLLMGWAGGSPMPSGDDNTGKSDPVSLNQGYYVHGIYTCVPDYENVLTTVT